MAVLGTAWGVAKVGAVGFTACAATGALIGATGGVGAVALAGGGKLASVTAGAAAWAGNGLEALVPDA